MHEIRNTLPHLGASAARSLQIAFRERLSRALRWQFPREDWVERGVCTVTIFFLFLADLFDTLWEIQHFQNKYCKECSLFCWILKLNEALKLAGQFHYHCLLEKTNSWQFQRVTQQLFFRVAAILWRKILNTSDFFRHSITFPQFWVHG